MRHIGFAIRKNELWYSVLVGDNKSACVIKYCDKHIYRADQSFPDLMLYFYNLFYEVLNEHNPDTVAYKIHLDSKLDQIPYMHCSLGVLGYLCKQRNIEAIARSGSWITAGKGKKIQQCLTVFSDADLKNEKLHATLIAWYQFED